MSVDLSEDDIKEIMKWAIGTGSLAIIMNTSEPPSDIEELKAHHDALLEGINTMVEQMPAVLADLSEDNAGQVLYEYDQNEAIVAEFVEELDDL